MFISVANETVFLLLKNSHITGGKHSPARVGILHAKSAQNLG
jgi:hypothetical protein